MQASKITLPFSKTDTFVNVTLGELTFGSQVE